MVAKVGVDAAQAAIPGGAPPLSTAWVPPFGYITSVAEAVEPYDPAFIGSPVAAVMRYHVWNGAKFVPLDSPEGAAVQAAVIGQLQGLRGPLD